MLSKFSYIFNHASGQYTLPYRKEDSKLLASVSALWPGVGGLANNCKDLYG